MNRSMKKFLVYLTAILFLASCAPSNDKRAKDLIEAYLKENLNDFASYESMSFSSLDSLFSVFRFHEQHQMERYLKEIREERKKIFENDKRAKNANNRAQRDKHLPDNYKRNMLYYDNLMKIIKTSEKEIERNQNEYNRLKNKKEDEFNSFQPSFIGWSLSHKFRATNAFGAKIINEMIFYFDRDVFEITHDFTPESLMEYERLKLKYQ